MDEPTIVAELEDCLEIFGQQSSLRIYTQICFCYPFDDANLQSTTVNTLTDGLERLTASFPWIAGGVVIEGSGKGISGVIKIKPWERIPRLVVKDLRHDATIPSMDILREAKFPFSMLDENTIAPCKTLPEDSDESRVDPVFLLQANFIRGGLLLTIVGQHNAMDMIGQGQVIHLLSKACHNKPFTSEELSTGNLARRNLVPLLDDSYEEGPELAYQIVRPIPTHPISSSISGQSIQTPPQRCTWAYFTFPNASLATLKSLATESITSTSGYISTDDALSAFIWQSIIRARLARLAPSSETMFARAVNVREYLDIPPTYPGLMQNMTYHAYTVEELLSEPLGAVASQLRSALDPKTSSLNYNTRALATFLNRAADKSIVSFTATLELSKDIMLSSWAKLDCYDLDFNLGLGKAVAVRRPQFEPVESLIYLMPRRGDGEIAVAVCLREEDMERLRVDHEFKKYGTYIG